MSPLIRVLVVDDSAFARKVLREVLAREPDIEVIGTARDGLDALEKIAALRPDVVTLDLVMPELAGVEVLRALPSEHGPRVIVVSSSAADSELALEALERGAVDMIHKPSALAVERLYEVSAELVRKVRAAAGARPRRDRPSPARVSLLPTPVRRGPAAPELVVVGASTGGPQAFSRLLAGLPADLPVPIALALHIPAGYTASLARRLDQTSPLRVREALERTPLRAGQAVLATGGRHLRVEHDAAGLWAAPTDEPSGALFRPSVDLLFASAAAAAGPVLAVVLTGMGRDGEQGARAVVARGGRVLVEAEASCVVYGMPRAVLAAGIPAEEARLDELAGLIVARVAATTP